VQENYIANFVQATFNALKEVQNGPKIEGGTLVVSGDGRYCMSPSSSSQVHALKNETQAVLTQSSHSMKQMASHDLIRTCDSHQRKKNT
jgi:phosphoglucomutase